MDINTPIVDAYGRQVFNFGGQNAFETHEYRGYFVSLEWFVGRRSTEPMMILRDAKAGNNAGAFGICLSSIGKYADPDTSSGAAPGALAECWKHLDCLGKPALAIEASLLLDVILHFATKLILMPPTPRAVVREARPDEIIDVELTDETTGRVTNQVSL
jgi:hypothetical protein